LRSNLNPKNPIDLVSDFLPKRDDKLVEESKVEVQEAATEVIKFRGIKLSQTLLAYLRSNL